MAPGARVPGVDYAADAVSVPDAVRPAVEHLLRDVAVVDDVPSAASLVRREPSLRAVTREGELVGAHWAQGGAAGGQGLLQMRATLDEATEDLAAAETAAGVAADELSASIEREQSAQTALEAAEAAAGEAQSSVNQAQSELDRVRARLREFDAQAAQEASALRAWRPTSVPRGEAERLTKALDAATESLERDTQAAEELAMRLAESEEAAEVADEAGHDTETRDELNARVQSCAPPRWRRGCRSAPPRSASRPSAAAPTPWSAAPAASARSAPAPPSAAPAARSRPGSPRPSTGARTALDRIEHSSPPPSAAARPPSRPRPRARPS